MPFARPTLAELIDTAQGDIQTRLKGADAQLRRSVLNTLAAVSGGGLDGLYGYLDWQSRQLFPQTAEIDALGHWGSLKNVARKPAAAAAGQVSFTGTDGSVVPAGTVLQRSDGVEFAVDADAAIAAGVGSGTATASLPGASGNTAALSKLTFPNPIAGVQSTATVVAGGIVGGIDQETVDAWRGRIITRWQKPPQGGNADDYEAWALAQPGVTRAWSFRNWMGIGTVGLAFVLDGGNPIFPDAGQVAAVQSALDLLRPVTAELFVFAPAPLPVNLTIRLNPSTQAVKDAVAAELADLFARESEPGATIYLSHIRQSVSDAAGEIDNTVTIPAADVVAPAGQMPTLGAITWL